MQGLTGSKPTALIICFSELNRDPRVLRQIEWMRDTFRITTVGLAPSGFDGLDHVQYAPAPRSSLAGKTARAIKYFGRDYESFYWTSDKTAVIDALASREFDVIVANDVDTLPLALKIAAKSTHVHFDAHEYAPLEFEDRLRFRILRQPLVTHICRKYIPLVASASTVCRGIADKYEEEFGTPFAVITNAAEYQELSPSPTSDKIRLIYHGLAHPSRITSGMIEVMRHLDERFELNLMLVGDDRYIARLKKAARSLPSVRFLEPVETKQIAKFTNSFDIGLFLLPPTNFNYLHALPNKFFEFIQARLAVAVSPSPEMAAIVRERDLGVVSDDFEPESMARAINALTVERIEHFKAQAHKHARDLSAEKNRELFLGLIESAKASA